MTEELSVSLIHAAVDIVRNVQYVQVNCSPLEHDVLVPDSDLFDAAAGYLIRAFSHAGDK